MKILMTTGGQKKSRGYIDTLIVRKSISEEEYQRLIDKGELDITLGGKAVHLEAIYYFPGDLAPAAAESIATALRLGIERGKKMSDRSKTVSTLSKAESDYLHDAGWESADDVDNSLLFTNKRLSSNGELVGQSVAVQTQKRLDNLDK